MRNFMKAAGAAALLAVASTAHAEFIGLEIGAAGWRAAPSGWIEDEGTGGSGMADLERDLGLDDEFGGFAWVRVMHPIPLLPNIKLTYTPLKFDGSGTVGGPFSIGGVNFAGQQVRSEAELNQIDATLFYELLDNIVDLDVGLNVKVLDGYFKVTNRTTGDTAEIDFNAPIPMLYANVGVNLPFTGLSAAVEGAGIAYSGNRLVDVKAGVRYSFAGVVAVEAGYRRLQLKLDDIDDLSSDLTVDGPYLGVMAKF